MGHIDIRNTELGETFTDIEGNTILTEAGDVRVDIGVGENAATLTLTPGTAHKLAKAIALAADRGMAVRP